MSNQEQRLVPAPPLPPMEPKEPGDLYFDSFNFFSAEETLTLDPPSTSTKTPEETLTLTSSTLPPPPPISTLRRRHRRHRLRSSAGNGDGGSEITVASEGDRAVDNAPDRIFESSDRSVLVSTAAFLIKSILFQISLISTLFALPIRLLRFSFSLLNDPCGTLTHSIRRVKSRLFGALERVMNQNDVGKLAVRLALGCFLSAYVGFMLVGILVTAFLGAGLLMRSVVEEPLHMLRDLSFDYTKPSPVALVPLELRGEPAVRSSRRLQLVISLTLPESAYNQNLGVFQVRAEFLSEKGRVTYSSSQPCMLRFKSSYVRLVETLLKSASLLSGYSSESQIIRIKMTGLVEGTEPTVCMRVILEQRAEYRPGAGIPQIYAASLKVESELPLLKRILWNWRRTIFIWVGMGLFVFELLFVLICCRPIIIPNTRPIDESPSRMQQ